MRINEFRIFTFVYLSFNAIEGFANPIYVAEKVLTSSSACMLASYGAKRFAQKHGFQEVSNDKLLAPETVLAYQQWKQDKPDGKRINEAGGLGAVVMDFDRNLAAATSTGGMLGNEVGRIGDSPIAGMGVFADNNLGISIYLKI